MAEFDYKDKIRKLLALAESDNENEARAALLKAKELMAEHKLTEAELKEVKSKKVKKIVTETTCSKRREPWIVNLSNVIGENYCCQAYRTKVYDKQTSSIGFVGLEDDIEICIAIFNYAVDCVRAEHKRMKKKYSPAKGYASDEARNWVKNELNGYGFGFATGVRKAFEEQKREKEQSENGWALVMVMPTEVKKACSDFKSESFSGAAHRQMSRSAFRDGEKDGKQFDPGSKLSSGYKAGQLCLA